MSRETAIRLNVEIYLDSILEAHDKGDKEHKTMWTDELLDYVVGVSEQKDMGRPGLIRGRIGQQQETNNE